MTVVRAAPKQRRNWKAQIVLGGLVLFAGVSNYLHNGVVSNKRVPPGYTYRRPKGEYAEIPWSALRKGDWPRGGKPRTPSAVQDLDGKPVMVKGWLLPLHNATAASEFFISTRASGCPFCNPVGVGDLVTLQTKGGRKMEMLDLPVMAFGTLHVATGAPMDQSLYLMTDTTIVVGQ